MASTIMSSFICPDTNPAMVDALSLKDWDYPMEGVDIALCTSTTYGSSVPDYTITPIHTPIPNQHLLGTMGDEWYNRIHLVPSTTQLGNLLSTQEIDIEVWNGFFEFHTLNTITESGTDSMVLSEPAPTPLVYSPLESHEYTVSVAVSGPPTIDGQYSFDFDVYSILFAVTGRRVVVWPFIPQADFIESVEFKTDVLKSKSNEQRIALRAYPRVSYQGTFILDENNFSTLKSIMTQWGYRTFAFPVWPEFALVGAVPAGTTVLNIDTTQSSYMVDGIVLLYQDTNTYEAAEVESFTDTTITVKSEFLLDFSNAVVMPGMFMSLLEGIAVERDSNEVPVGRATLTGFDSVDIASDTGKTQLRGKDVYLRRNAALSAVSEKLFTDVEILDDGVGVQLMIPNRTFSEHEQVISFECADKSQVWEVKEWLYSLKGRQKSFFIPSWSADLSLIDPLTTASTSLLVTSIQYSLYRTGSDLLLKLKDGTELLLQVLVGSDVGGGQESLSLSTQVGQDIELDEIELICFISHVRLDADRFEVNYNSGGGATISIPIREIPE